MKSTRSIYLALLAVLLSPMAANADMLIYESNVLDDGSYMVAFAEVSSSAEGLYDDVVGLLDFGITVYDSADVELFSLTSADEDYFDWTNFIHIAADGSVDEWWLVIDARGAYPNTYAYTHNSTGQYSSYSFTGNDYYQTFVADQDRRGGAFDNPGSWSTVAVPEPGTLALLGLGLVGMAARRRKKV